MLFAHISIIVATITVVITTPVVAEPTWKPHYIVRDNATGRCIVVELYRGIVDHDITPPHTALSVGLIYRSRALADAALEEGARYANWDCSVSR